MPTSSKAAAMVVSNSPFLFPVLLLVAMAVTAESLTANVLPGCQGSCGGVEIPYPFGIGAPGCFRKGFEISCINNDDGAGDIPVLGPWRSPVLKASWQPIRVLNLYVAPRPEARVSLQVAYQCFNSNGVRNESFPGDFNFNHDGVFRISNSSNELYVLGCNTLAYTNHGEPGRYRYSFYTGCVAYSNDSSDPQDGTCAGVGCCHVDIPPGLTNNTMTFMDDNFWSKKNQSFCPCDYAFIVEKGNYTFRASDLTTMPRDQTMPLVIDWAIRDRDNGNSDKSLSCPEAKNRSDYACRSRDSECFNSTNGPGYICNCTKGYEGNPYVPGGCTDIDECKMPDKFPCHGICTNIIGDYDCKCKAGYESGDKGPKEDKCHPKRSHSATIALGISVGTFVLIVTILVTWLMFKNKELKAKKRELEEIAKKNGSEILKNVKTLKLFTKEEIDIITENYAKYVGRGAFGKVYKGTLPDMTEVAVKESIEVTEETKGEFVKEVEIQSSMMHRNILKLLGCCLSIDRPLLVYEYAKKGSLQDILHGNETQPPQPLPLNSRLKIAIGSAQGLAYMHKYTKTGIQHVDVKPSNILLDGALVPKISDFRLSKVFKLDRQYTTHIVGSLDYMDPMSIVNKRLTPKSDVYSFGIVLLELICRKSVVSRDTHLTLEFKRVFNQDKSGKAIFDMEIAQEENIPLLHEIGKLAMKCLNENFEERPDMESVASALVILKDTWETRNPKT